MRLKSIFLTLFVLLSISLCVSAQNDVQLSQYWEGRSLYNPAASGEGELLRLRGGSRMQWVGMLNPPKSFFASGDMSMGFVAKGLGAGATLNQESLGLFTNLNIAVQGSFSQPLWGGRIAGGVSVGYFNSKFRGTGVVIPDGDDYHQGGDPAIPTRDLVGQTIDLGLGVWYSNKNIWGGLSALHLASPVVSLGEETATGEQNVSQYETSLPRTFYFMAGGNIPVKNTLLELQPSLFLMSNLQTLSSELTLRCRYNKFASLGVGYRHNIGVGVNAGVELKNFYVGYSYEYPLTDIARISTGSHEVMVGYSLKIDFGGEARHRHRSVRLM